MGEGNRQKQTGGFMKKNLVLLGVVAMLAGMTGLLFAGAGAEVQIAVPFDFYVDGELLPAGEYVFNMGPVGPVTASSIVIRSKDGAERRLLVTMPDVNENTGNASLKFRQYGDKYFLSSVAIRSYKANLKTTTLEKELKAQAAGRRDTLATVVK
jgi:hypothetical protein